MFTRYRRILFLLLFCVAYYGAFSQACPGVVISASPSCGGPCTGTLSVFIPASCSAGPYNVLVSNGACSSQASTMGVSGLTTPTNYVITNACPCSLSNYQVLVLDSTGALAAQSNVNFIANPITVTSNTVAPTCNLSCNGSISGNIFGSGPFSVSVLPSTVTPSTFTTNGAYSLTNLCGGIYTMTVSDAFGCSTTVTRTLAAPATISPNAITQSITCNAFSNGSFSIAPTGGTGNFNVQFSTGPTFNNVAPGSSVGINSLPPGVVSVTITDVNSCSVTTGTTITQPTTINIVPSQTNVICGGNCTGVASVAVSGGGGSYTYSWSSSPATTAGAGSLCAGQHTVTITDNFTCVKTQSFSITQPASITITPTITNLTCNNVCAGAVSVTSSGPPGPITYTWLSPPSGNAISNASVISSRCAGVYTLLASAAATCVNTFTIPITQPPAATLTALTTSVNCIGFCNGSATANISGGNGAPYTFTWTAASGTPAPQNGQQASGLCAGTHTLSARDASNCASSVSFSITQPTPFSFGVTTTSVNCNGACTGVINASPGGGTAPYNFTLVSSGSTVTSASPVFTGLCAGSYSLRVADNSAACPQQTVVTITQPQPLIPSVNVTSITCASQCNGILAGSATGGSPGYTLSWNTSTGSVAGGVLTNRCAGSYTFNITDANGCNSTPTVVALTAPPALTVNITPTNANCFGNCNGMLSASVSGGTPGYSLNWSTGFNSNPLTNLCAGNYTLTVTDANSCTLATTASVSAPSSITVTQSVTPTRCAGSCDGSATITATGGAGSYSFHFNSSPTTTNTTGIINNLCAGNYIATVTDANNCAQPLNFSMTSPVALSSAITGTRNSCTSCTGAATITASNGTAPYSSVWTNSLNTAVGTGSVVSTLCPGNYTIVTTDSRSCTATTTVGITQIVIITVVNGGTGIQCFGSCTGSVVANASGGQPPYTFNWSPGTQTTSTATNLCAGNYTVNVTDSNSPACINTATINVPEPPDMVITSSQTNVSCFNVCNGAISLSVTGGTGAKSYTWSPGGMNTASVSGLCQGVYQVTVSDANGCPKPPLSFTIAPPFPPITAVVNATDPLNCNNPNSGTVCVTPSGGNGSFTYSWVPAAPAVNCVNGVPAGTYSVLVTSAGCTNTFATTLTNPTGPALTQLSLQQVSCFSGTNGAISYSASGNAPFTYSWTPAVPQVTTASTSSVSGLGSGTYVIAVGDAGNCVSTATILITQPASVTVNAAVSGIQCSGVACNGSITVAPTGGTAPYTYTWSPGGSNSPTLSNQCAGIKTLTLRDNNLCPSTYTFNITTPSSITVSSTVTNIRCNAACNGSVVAFASGGTGPISYSWLPQAGFSGSTTASIQNLCPGTYTLHASDANNCVTVHTVNLTEPPPLNSTLSVQNINCSSSCNGGATLTASGGVPTYSFSWSSTATSSQTLGNLCAGNYTGHVTDANGCVSSKGFTIASPTVFSLNLSPAHPLCNATCNGSVQTLVSGAQGSVAYVWAPAGNGQNPVNLCPGSYTVNATDANGCQAQGIVTLNNPPALLANVTTANPSCNGSCNGVAISTPVNAQGAVSYTWLPSGPNSATNTGLCAGNFSLAISDANGCTFSQTFAVTQPAALNVNVSAGPATCGSNNGSITAAPVGGTPNYTFAWTAPAPPPILTTGSVVSNLAAGLYTVTITDANNCSNTVTIPLSNSNGPTAPLTSTNVTCNGNCTGAASVGIISGGTPPYATPVWVVPAPSVQASAIFSLCAGGYSVELRDANNCLNFAGITITEPPPVNIIPTTSLPLCAGVCDGTITINTSGGIAPYTYTWTPGSTSGSVLTNACAGTYSILVGYNNGSCTSQQVVNITPQTSINIGPPLTNPNRCFGDCAGAATINVLSTGGGSTTLSWSNGQAGATANNLCNGIYSVTVTDQQGCANTFSVPISSPPQLTVNPAITQPDCGLCNGSATVSAGGGAGGTYTLNWSNGSSAATTSALCAGLYQVQVRDSLNCLQTINIPVNSSSGITGETINTIDESCSGLCDGSATVTATGGTLPISYSWLNAPVPTQSNTVSNLCSDVYFVQMTDANDCRRTASVNIGAATTLSILNVNSPPSCNASDGTITVVVNGGTPPYTYNWSPAAPGSATLSNVPAGSYTLTVTDQNGSGCARSKVIVLTDRTGPAFGSDQTNLSCFGDCDGSVTLTSTLSPAPGFTWSTGSNAAAVTGLCEGIVTVTVEANGCKTVRDFTINTQPLLRLITQVSNVACFGSCNGALAALPIGGKLPYTFTWPQEPGTAGNSIDSLCAGAYTVQISDANGCLISESDTVSQSPQAMITFTTQNATCVSVADGSVQVELAGGTPGFNYNWQGPAGFSSTLQVLEDILPGTYSLTVTDSLNCTIDTLLSVVPTVTVVAEAGSDFSVCPGSPAVLSGANSQGAESYQWYEIPQNANAANTVSFSLSQLAFTQTFALRVEAVNPACFDLDTVVVGVFEEPYLDAGPSYTIPVFSSVTIGGNPTADGVATLTWSPDFYLSDANAENPVASNTVDVTFTVSMLYGDGCLVSDTMVVALYPEIKIHSAFTPNSDGRNDTWIIDYIDQFPGNTVEIYNRWGELLFHSKGYREPFDGTYNGKKLPVGTYYYVVILNHPSYPKPYTGPVTIFR